MTIEAREVSNELGAPIALYEIEWGETKWYYTSADEDQVLDVFDPPRTYTAIPIRDSGMTQGGSSKNDITITLPYDLDIVDLFASTPPSSEIWLRVRQTHEGETELPLMRWIGVIGNVKRKEGNVEADIIGRTLLSTFRRAGLRLAWTRGCPHMVYDHECRASKEAMAVPATITALSGNTITLDAVDGKAAGWFDGGFFEWEATAEGTIDRRGIAGNVDDTTLIVYGTTYRLEVGMAVTLYPGCDLIDETCDLKFNNLPNYGGLRQMTGKNPFDGTSIV